MLKQLRTYMCTYMFPQQRVPPRLWHLVGVLADWRRGTDSRVQSCLWWHYDTCRRHHDIWMSWQLNLLRFFFSLFFFYLLYSVSSIGLFCLHCFSNKQKERWLQPSVHSNTVMRAWSCKSHLWVRTSIKVSSLLLPFHCFSLVHKYDNSGYKPGLFGVKTFCLRWWKSGFDFNRELSLIN